jgi:hypothetical protein
LPVAGSRSAASGVTTISNECEAKETLVTLRKKLCAVAGVVAMAGALVASAVPASASPTSVDITHDSITCNGVVGKISFATALTLSGPTTGGNTIKLSAALSGCVDSTNNTVQVAPTKLSVTLATAAGSNCDALLGNDAVSGTATVKWKDAVPSARKLVMTGSVPAATTVNFSGVDGGTYTADSWGAGYGAFTMVAPSQMTVSGAAVGNDNGDGSAFFSTTGMDVVGLLSLCNSPHGLKTATFGIGYTTFG